MAGINEEDYSKVLKTLPVIDLDKVLLKKENPYRRNGSGTPTTTPTGTAPTRNG